MALVSLTRTTVYDVDNDLDIQADRVDHLEKEEVLAYVPAGSNHRKEIIQVLEVFAKSLNDSLPDNGSGNPPASP